MRCEQCERDAIARGMCAKHYQRWKRTHRSEVKDVGYGVDPVDRIMSRVALVDDCWIYQWTTEAKGYARVRVNGVKKSAHRVMWEHFISPIPDGLTFDHLCKTPSCVNPYHGELVPLEVNSARNSNAAKTHCPKGHELAGDNLRYATRGTGRVCRACRSASDKAYRERKKAMS
jgi:HNH endonuclease